MTAIYHYGDNVAWKGVLTTTILNVFGIFIIGLRVWSRRLTKVGFGWDDAFAVFAIVLVNAMLGVFAPRMFILLSHGKLPLHLSSESAVKDTEFWYRYHSLLISPLRLCF